MMDAKVAGEKQNRSERKADRGEQRRKIKKEGSRKWQKRMTSERREGEERCTRGVSEKVHCIVQGRRGREQKEGHG